MTGMPPSDRFDFADLSPALRYKLLVALVLPRPIALVSSQDSAGRLNAAPFSFFNVFSEAPALVVLGVDGRDGEEDGLKDTARNIAETGEFVVNLVDTALLEAMNVCAVDMPADFDELHEAGLTPCDSALIGVPGISEAPARLECRLWQEIPLGAGRRRLILGEVLGIGARRGIVDPVTHRVDIDRLDLVGRMHGGGNYLRLTDRLVLPRIDVADWQAGRK